MMKTTLPIICAACLALSACQTTTTGGNPAISSSNAMHSEVEIIDGDTYTATWIERPTTAIRLAYSSEIALSDARITEIAEMMSGCTGTGAAVQTALVGGITSVHVPATCNLQRSKT